MLYLLIILLTTLLVVFIGYNYVNNNYITNKNKNKNKIKPLQEGIDENLEEVNGKVYQLIGRVKSLEKELINVERNTNKALGTSEDNEKEVEEGKKQVSDEKDKIENAQKKLENIDFE